uniref:Uncharacterized protein n=1 Tax=Salix viminalis TaxID=40686 RepID=A0A6N2LPB2_SALVM
MDDEGLMLEYELLRQGFEIDFVTDTAVLPAASNLRNQEIGKQSHAYLLRHEIHFEGINGYAIDIHSGLVDEGLQIFKSIEKDFKSKPSTPHHCCITDMLGRVGRVIEAYEFVKELGEIGNVLEICGSFLGA